VPATVRSLASRSPSLLLADTSPAEAHVLRLAARAAEDAGDFPGAFRLVSGLPDGRSSRLWRSELELAVALDPEDLAGLACWLVHPAVRWARERPTGAVFERHAAQLLKTMGVGAEYRLHRTAAVACTDPAVVDAGLFDTGLFGDYLLSIAGSPLLERLRGVELWPAQFSLVWQVVAVGARELVMCDLWSGRDVRVQRRVGTDALVRGAIVYGRVVQVAGDPELAFVLPAERVDQRCATRLLRARRQGSGPEERLRAVGHSRRRAMSCASAAGEYRL
jgi:hypothetical protein